MFGRGKHNRGISNSSPNLYNKQWEFHVNDIGGAIALALILGLIYGVLGHGLGWLSEKIEDWKNPHREKLRPLTEEQQQEVKTFLSTQATSYKHKTTLIATDEFFCPPRTPIGPWRENLMRTHGIQSEGDIYLWNGNRYPSFDLVIVALKEQRAQ